MPTLKQVIKGKVKKQVKQTEPLWRGPAVDGLTQSLIGRYLACKERFRLLTMEGLRPVEGFNQRLEYGNMWHLCEEAMANHASYRTPLVEYCRELSRRYPTSGEQINHWFNVCSVQFPVYAEFWTKHPDVKNREPIGQEIKFEVPYELPSGRTVLMRGKFDSVDVIREERTSLIYLQENKTKSDIDVPLLMRQLSFDLQTMFYIIALKEAQRQGLPPFVPNEDVKFSKMPIVGVRYNVIRRPLSGGKHSIRKHQPSKSNPAGETDAQYYARLAGLIQEEVDIALKQRTDCFYFMRFKVRISDHDITNFKEQTLDPLLEEICDWWGYMNNTGEMTRHYRMPYGVYSPLMDGSPSELDEFLASGSRLGLERATTLFPELEV